MTCDDDRPAAGARPDTGAEEAEEPRRRNDEEAERDPPAAARRPRAPEPGGSLKPERVQ